MFVILNTILSILRIPIFYIFYRKTRTNHFTKYYFIWLLAIAAWGYDGACVYYTLTQSELNESIFFFESVFPFIVVKVIFILATGRWYYLIFIKDDIDKQQDLNHQQEENVRKEVSLTFFTFPLSRYKFKWVYLALSVTLTTLIYLTGSSSVTDDTPFPYINLMLLINNFQSLFFLAKNTATSTDGMVINIWHLSASWLIAVFFVTVTPLNTLYQFIFLIWKGSHASLPTWMISPTMSIVAWNIYLAESMISTQIDFVTRAGLVYWPDFESNKSTERRVYETIV